MFNHSWSLTGHPKSTPRYPRSRRVLAGCLALILGLILQPPLAHAQVTLNEILADNVTAIPNEDEYPDYVELYNAGSTRVELADWSLTDNLSQPRKYVFPAGTRIPSGGTLLVYLDNEDELPGLHAGFSLNSKGELLALYNSIANGSGLADLIVFGLQLPDLSIGRVPDGSPTVVLNRPTPDDTNVAMPMGATTNLFINEWMADPSSGDDWLELYNEAFDPVAIGGLVLTDDPGIPGNRAIPALSFIGAGGFIQFIADNLDNDDADHLDFRLSNNGEILSLYESDRATLIHRIIYGDQDEDISQGLLPDGSSFPIFFPDGRDTPGSSNFLPLTDIVVNELLSHTDPPLEDAVELLNVSSQPIDLSYWWLSDARNSLQKYQIPLGTIIPAGGYAVFYEEDFNPDGTGENPSFTFNSARGDELYISSGNAAGRLTGFRGSIEFGTAQNGVPFGRHTNSLGEVVFVPMSQLSFGVNQPASLAEFRMGTGQFNPAPFAGEVVFHEIMYHPTDRVPGEDNSLDEYIELYNRTNITVTLYDPNFPTNKWRVSGGVDFEFEGFQSLEPGQSLLLVNFDPATDPVQLATFRTRYQVADTVPIVGPYSGKLDNREENLKLMKPDTPQGPDRPDAGLVPYLLVDRVKYEDRDPWPESPDGDGQALQRIAPELYGNDPVSWTAATPTPGTLALAIDSLVREGNVLRLRFRALSNRGYTVQYREAVDTGAWMTLTNVPAMVMTGDREVVDVIGTANRFYRLVTPIQP